MDYKQYSVEDFVLDQRFRKWVLNPDQDARAFWTQWLDEHPQKAETVKQAIELLRQIPVQQNSLSEQQMASISKAIEEGIDLWEESGNKSTENDKTVPISAYAMTRQKLETKKRKKTGSRSLWIKIAASVVFLLGMLCVFYDDIQHQEQEPGIVYEEVIKENPKGQKLTVFLSDGTKVVLNAGSKLSFTKPFHPERRKVTLQGEAFFEVVKDSLRPFQVVSDVITTTALGTSFNIAAYPNDNYIKVSLTSGKVKVDYQQVVESQKPEVYYLVPGEQLGYDKENQSLSKSPFDTNEVLAWKEGVLYLENTDQATVIKTLERWYGVQIEIEGKSVTPWSVTAKFNNQSLKSVLTSLSYTMGFEFEIKENYVLIKYPTNT